MSHQRPDLLADLSLPPAAQEALKQMQSEMQALRHRIFELEGRLQQADHFAARPNLPANLVLNRTDFNREVARMLAMDARFGGLSSIIYFELSNLPALLAGLSMQVQHELLEDLMTSLCRQIRQCDVVGRLAEGELGLLLVRCDEGQAWTKAAQLAQLLLEQAKLHLGATPLEISYGVYGFTHNAEVSNGLRAAAGSMLQHKPQA